MPVFIHAMPADFGERLPAGLIPIAGVRRRRRRALACAGIITSGLAERHPRLRLAFSHGAGGFPMMLPRAKYFWGKTWNEEPSSGGRGPLAGRADAALLLRRARVRPPGAALPDRPGRATRRCSSAPTSRRCRASSRAGGRCARSIWRPTCSRTSPGTTRSASSASRPRQLGGPPWAHFDNDRRDTVKTRAAVVRGARPGLGGDRARARRAQGARGPRPGRGLRAVSLRRARPRGRPVPLSDGRRPRGRGRRREGRARSCRGCARATTSAPPGSPCAVTAATARPVTRTCATTA